MDRPLSPSGMPRARGRRVTPRKKQIEDALDLLYRRRWIILGTFALVAAAASAYMFTRPTVYRADALVTVDLTKVSTPNSPMDLAGSGAFVRDNRSVATELFLLENSRGIDQRVSERLADQNGRMPPGGVSFQQADRTVFSAIRIVAQSPDPEAAAALANAYAEEYVEQTQISSRSHLTAQRELLEEQKERLETELESAEGVLEGVLRRGGVAALPGQGNALNGRLAQLEAERDIAQIELQKQRGQLRVLDNQINDINPQLLTQRMTANNRQEIERLDALIQNLKARRLPMVRYEESRNRNPSDRAEIAAIDRQIAPLEAQRARLAAEETRQIMSAGGQAAPEQAMSFVAGLRSQKADAEVALSGLQSQIGALNQRIAEARAQLSRVPGTSTAVARGERNRQQAAQTYEYVMSQLQQIRVQEEAEPGYASVLRAASVPSFGFGPGPARGLALSLLAGLGLGIALAFGLDKVDNRVHKPEDVSELGLSVLEAIPDLNPLVRDELGGAQTIEVGGRHIASELVALHAPLSPASETYRHLRTGVQFSRPDVVVRSVLLTSAGAGEGKSTTAANLAITLAQAGRRTVLIDCDIRRPRQQDLFGMSGDYGLAQLMEIADRGALQAELDRSFRQSVDNLYVVPTGAVATEARGDLAASHTERRRISNPSELLGSPQMRAFLDTVKDIVDVIVIDTPPVLAATDAVLLSTQADATVLVSRAGVTKAGDMDQALAHLDDVGAHVVGGVLNGFSLEHAFGYAYSYGHYSRYGPYSKYGAYTEDNRPRERRTKRSASRGQTAA